VTTITIVVNYRHDYLPAIEAGRVALFGDHEPIDTLLDGIRSSAGSPTPTLKPGGDGRLRAREFLTGVGARGPDRGG
jgi:hypothetical protein